MSKSTLVLVFFSMILTSVRADVPGPMDDVREAVFRHQIDRWKASTYYLALGIDRAGEYNSPPAAFMQRFAGQSNVKKCYKGLTLEEGSVVLCIDHVKLGEKSAEVNARFVPFEVTKASSGYFNLELQKDGSWKVVKTSRFKVIPLEH